MVNKALNPQKVLVTGGAGYIGSHTCLELVELGYDITVIDNLSNGNYEAIKRVEEITGKVIPFFEIDLRNYADLDRLFSEHLFKYVIHFAGYKAVGESVENPLLYYSNNVLSSINLLQVMKKYNVNDIVFSSSCTVYGKPKKVPVKETDNLEPTNPYGRSKLMVENILKDYCESNQSLNVTILRYFNPIGAHPSGKIGEDPKGIPNNLLPFISKVAIGLIEKLNVFGGDYDTKDGTGVRDYLHVVDLANAHVMAIDNLTNSNRRFNVYNLGTGEGYSVLEIIKTFEKVSGKKISYEIIERRAGDVDKTYADPSLANKELNWKAERNLQDMCKDIWEWQLCNPNGYS